MVSRRRFMVGSLGGALSLSGCSTIEQSDNKFYCQSELARFNPGLCNQLNIIGIIDRMKATLSMLFGVQHGAEISDVLQPNIRSDALQANHSQLIEAYIAQRDPLPVSQKVSSVVNNIRLDQRLCEATNADLTFFSRRIENQEKASFNERLNIDNVRPRILNAAKKNINSFEDGNFGYEAAADLDRKLSVEEVKRSNEILFERIRIAQDTFNYLHG